MGRMTQQPFSRPGAVDLSGLQGVQDSGPAAGGAGVSGAYTVQIDEQNFSSVLESSMNAAVLLAFYSPSRAPESVHLADDLQLLSNEFEILSLQYAV